MYLGPGDEADGTGNGTNIGKEIDTLVQSLQDQIVYLRAELQRRGETHAEEARRKDTIIAQLAQRIPELPAPASQGLPEQRNTSDPASEDLDREGTPPRAAGACTAPLVATEMVRVLGPWWLPDGPKR